MAEKEQLLRIDGWVEISCESDGRVANMILHAPQNGGAEVNYDQVCGEIARLGITTNIDESNIKRVIAERLYDLQVCVAVATPPKKGKNGYISFRFDKDHKLKPRQNEFGIADYRELNAIVPIHRMR